jgi:hypothetical protein
MAQVQQGLTRLKGFDIEPQTKLDAVGHRPIVKCCNAAWQAQRVARTVKVANVPSLWEDRKWLEALIGPCKHLKDSMCGHHGFANRCAYLDDGFADKADPVASLIFENPPVVDLKKLAEESA